MRFFNWLFNRPGDPYIPHDYCKTCEVLKQQLNFERHEKEMLLETLTSLLKPQVIVSQGSENLKPITPRFKMFSKRRVELEKADSEQARVKRTSIHIAKTDDELKKDVVEELKPKEIKIEETIIPIVTPEVRAKTLDELERELGIEETSA